ncbi:MAG: copper-binding protein [Thermoanaerobaculia bacterium]|nr:copper-binding protein [Thermoanaerobaculia bacterium]
MNRFVFLLSCSLLLGAVSLSTGCGGQSTQPSPPDVYTVRGEIRRLPAAGKTPRELWLHHEDIPDFKDSKGEVVGMEAMTMPFPLADEVSLEGVAIGNHVEFVLEVRWNGKPPVVVSRLEKLAEPAASAASTGPDT